MKDFLLLLSLTIAASVFFCCSDSRSLTNTSIASETNFSNAADNVKILKDLEEKLELNGIKSYGIWNLSGKPKDKLFYFIGVNKDERDSESLSIFDADGKLLFQDSSNYFGRVFTFNILRQNRPQMIIPDINYGGSGRFFKILDYMDGKVISLTDEDEALYSGDFTILPQYQEKQFFALPFQVLLTENLVSEDAEATILRYVDGKYVSAGKVSQRDMWNWEKSRTKSVP